MMGSKKMKQRVGFSVSLLVLALMGGGILNSLSAAETGFKMAVVDLQAALNGVEEGKSAKAKLKKEFEAKQKDIDTRKKDLEGLQKKLEDFQTKASSGLLKPEAMEEGRKTEKEFRSKLEAYTTLVQGHQQDISKKEMEATGGIINKMRGMVTELGRKEGFSMVFEKNQSGLLYAASYTDLTEKLIQEYNKKHK